MLRGFSAADFTGKPSLHAGDLRSPSVSSVWSWNENLSGWMAVDAAISTAGLFLIAVITHKSKASARRGGLSTTGECYFRQFHH